MSQHDFNFLHGSWRVQNRRLKQRLEGSQAWEEFDAVAHVRPTLNGLGNVDEMFSVSGEPIGMTLRSFNRAEHRWYICWVNGQDGAFDPLLNGTFQDGVGLFYGQEEWNGHFWPCRFTWDARNPAQPHWAQALSADGGQTWETNWTMNLTQLEP